MASGRGLPHSKTLTREPGAAGNAKRPGVRQSSAALHRNCFDIKGSPLLLLQVLFNRPNLKAAAINGNAFSLNALRNKKGRACCPSLVEN
jgi:hypothetical protein